MTHFLTLLLSYQLEIPDLGQRKCSELQKRFHCIKVCKKSIKAEPYFMGVVL